MFGIPSTVVRFAIVVGLTSTLVGTSFGQVTTIYNSNGFDSGFATGPLAGQNGFTNVFGTPPQTVGSLQGAVVQNTFANSGPNSVQIHGPELQNTSGFAGGNFWFRPYTTTTGYNPVASGTPYVQVSFNHYTSGVTNPQDIPFSGVYVEGFNSTFNAQQGLTPIYVNLNGNITVFTTDAVGGAATHSVSTVNGLLGRNAWHNITTEFNFTAQTFRVYVNGSSTPVQFVTTGTGSAITPITDVPFRNTYEPIPGFVFTGQTTNRIAELGLLAFFGQDSVIPPLNTVYIDDYQVTATFAPVPEPGTILAVAAVGAFGLRTWRRRRAA